MSFPGTTTTDVDSVDVPFQIELPDYCQGSMLQPTTALRNDRYNTTEMVYPTSVNIVAGVHSTACLIEPKYLPMSWAHHVNPEGANYYVNNAGAVCVVTDAPLHKQDIREKIHASVEKIHILVEHLGFKLPADCELYIKPCSTSDKVSYYFVDHDSQTEFWLQNVDSEELDIPDVSSIEHLKYILQEHYWTHVEYFPHRSVSTKHRDELVNMLRHAQVDQLTSDSSTFPYDAEHCINFLALIEGSDIDNPYMTCVIARLWIVISQQRFTQFYSEDHARLCRFQRRFELSPVVQDIKAQICSALLFGMPSSIQKDLEQLFVDRIVYGMHWRKFMMTQERSWRESAYLSAGLITATAIALRFSRSLLCLTTGAVSLMLSLGALGSSIALLQRYVKGGEMNAATAAQHITEVEHDKYGFGPIAAIHSLPRALIYWTLVALAFHTLSYALTTQSIAMIATTIAMMLLAGAISFKSRSLLSNI